MATKYIMVESPVHGKDVLLAITDGSANEKTGDVCQIYILNPETSPLDAAKTGADEHVCGHCPQRHFLGGGCYVTLMHGPRAVYSGWLNTGKKLDAAEDVIDMLSRRYVRYGAYGDPAHIPAWFVSEINSVAKGWTAYTHAWRNPAVADIWRGKAMASLDHPSQIKTAEGLGWKWFLAVKDTSEIQVAGAVVCDNEKDDRTQCRDCMRCDGSNESVYLTIHGTRKNKF